MSSLRSDPPGRACCCKITAGVLSGAPSAGAFTVTVTVTDSLHYSTSMNFQVTFVSAGPVLQVSPTAITFSAVFQGDAPGPQFIDVVPVGTQPINFSVVVDGGAGGAGSWLDYRHASECNRSGTAGGNSQSRHAGQPDFHCAGAGDRHFRKRDRCYGDAQHCERIAAAAGSAGHAALRGACLRARYAGSDPGDP